MLESLLKKIKKQEANIFIGTILTLCAISYIGDVYRIKNFNENIKKADLVTKPIPGLTVPTARFGLFDDDKDGEYDKILYLQKIVAGKGAGIDIQEMYPNDPGFNNKLKYILKCNEYFNNTKKNSSN
ncbi:hypothetical protein K9L67_05345 [Candidatus Woesearchaeota archaeon]|nr:hypothetical protein [Candidatus Woesearchaeota archaeon]MCF8012998.1 hypothetical protein [Candidatus Woesearchaeota archaeon]